MVIVVMAKGREGMGTAAALSDALGWPLRTGDARRLDQVRQWTETALARRESIVIETPPLARAERVFVARDLARIRFISLAPLDEPPFPVARGAEEPLVVAASTDPSDAIRAARDAFGV